MAQQLLERSPQAPQLLESAALASAASSSDRALEAVRLARHVTSALCTVRCDPHACLVHQVTSSPCAGLRWTSAAPLLRLPQRSARWRLRSR